VGAGAIDRAAMLNRLCRLAVLAVALVPSAALAAASSATCHNPNALGVSRTIAVDPRWTPKVGSVNYGTTLPLRRREVVLTFDDGPHPLYTNSVLKALADECVRATFFMLGRQARAYPGMARRVLAAGHTVGTHTQNHPMHFMPPRRAIAEISTGIDSVGNALGSRHALAPFFRFPGLFSTRAAERYLRARGLMSWSIDIDSYDYRRIGADTMLRRLLANLERRQRGILLMHDIQPKTALMLPRLLDALKARGFRIVHVVPRSGGVGPGLMSQAHAPRADVRAADHAPPRKTTRRTRGSPSPVAGPDTFEAAFIGN
jgi:peptidoglycan/xylan/chitin deacetylase (PgdA/CDA1 family)